jgi:hypothetical protein
MFGVFEPSPSTVQKKLADFQVGGLQFWCYILLAPYWCSWRLVQQRARSQQRQIISRCFFFEGWIERMTYQPVTLGILFERTMEAFQFSCKTFLVGDGSSSLFWGGYHRMLIGQVVTQHSDSGWCRWACCIHFAPRNYFVFCICQCSGREGGHLTWSSWWIGCYWGGWGNNSVLILYKTRSWMCVIHVTEPTGKLLGHPAECHILEVFHKEIVNDKWLWWAHGNSVCS